MIIFIEARDSWRRKLLTKQEFAKFAADSLAGKYKDDQKAWIGDVTPEATARIKDICGQSVHRIMASSSAIAHAYRKENHNPLSTDIFHLVDAINSSKTIRTSKFKVVSEPWSTVLEFEADINGTLTFIELVRIPKDCKGRIDLATCYKKKKVKGA
jgi:hypothetical protein